MMLFTSTLAEWSESSNTVESVCVTKAGPTSVAFPQAPSDMDSNAAEPLLDPKRNPVVGRCRDCLVNFAQMKITT
jgi:hypothetical protein